MGRRVLSHSRCRPERLHYLSVETPGRILLIRPSALGDVCRTVPVLASLKRAFPNAAIDWLVQDTFIDSIVAHPDLNRAVPFPRSRLDLGKCLSRGYLRAMRGFLRELRAPKYDLVIDCQGLSRSGFFAWMTRAPARVGFRHAGELGWLGVNIRVETSATHTVDRMLTLLDEPRLGPVPVVRDMRLYVPDAARAVMARAPFDALEAGGYVVIAPTSRWPGKLWRDDRHIEVIRAMFDRGVERAVIVGSPGESAQVPALTEYAASEPRVIDAIGTTSIGELMAIIEGCRLMVAGDSAALHMAVGFDRPLVALFGPTLIHKVGPYGRDADVIQACDRNHTLSHKNETAGREAMDMISTSSVIDAVMARLDASDRPAPVPAEG